MQKNIIKNSMDDYGSTLRKMSRRMGDKALNIAVFILLIGLTFLELYPVFSMLSLAFRPSEEMLDETVVWISKSPTFMNFVSAFKELGYGRLFFKTVWVTAVCSLLQLISCSMAAYGLSRFKFKGQKLIFLLVIFTIVVPPQTAQVPTFVNFSYFDFFGLGKLVGLFTGTPLTVNILSTTWTMILPAMFACGLQAGLYIFVFRQFFMSMPKGLEEAARIDGCNFMQIFVKIIIPNAIPVFVVVFLLSMVAYWNDTAVTGIYLMKEDSYLLMHALRKTVSSFASDAYGYKEVVSNAMALISVAPIVLLFILCQRSFTEFLDRSGIKG